MHRISHYHSSPHKYLTYILKVLCIKINFTIDVTHSDQIICNLAWKYQSFSNTIFMYNIIHPFSTVSIYSPHARRPPTWSCNTKYYRRYPDIVSSITILIQNKSYNGNSLGQSHQTWYYPDGHMLLALGPHLVYVLTPTDLKWLHKVMCCLNIDT